MISPLSILEEMFGKENLTNIDSESDQFCSCYYNHLGDSFLLELFYNCLTGFWEFTCDSYLEYHSFKDSDPKKAIQKGIVDFLSRLEFQRKRTEIEINMVKFILKGFKKVNT